MSRLVLYFVFLARRHFHDLQMWGLMQSAKCLIATLEDPNSEAQATWILIETLVVRESQLYLLYLKARYCVGCIHF
jgi:hypothetical protein